MQHRDLGAFIANKLWFLTLRAEIKNLSKEKEKKTRAVLNKIELMQI
jgi:hypothetical protein